MNTLTKIALSLSASLVLVACGQNLKDTHPDQLLTKRLAIFKKFTKAFEPLGLVARDRQPYVKADFVAQALALQELSTQPWEYFSKEGNYPPTRAKSEVWTQPDAFKSEQMAFKSKVDALVQVSASADMTAIKDSVEAVQKSCKSCHDNFRNDTASQR